MGLDMYLTKKTYVKNWDHHKVEDRFEVTVKRGGEIFNYVKPERIKYIEEDIMYWRKANQIHSWFVKNVQDDEDNCKEYYVSIEKLKLLLITCKKVKDDNSLASILLPTQKGFFFGSYEYDEYYFQDIEDTITELEKVLQEDNSESDFYYYSSW